MTCAGAAGKGGAAHVKKEKAGNGVCGAMVLKGNAHVKKEEERNGVCGATPKKETSTRHPQKSHNNNKK